MKKLNFPYFIVEIFFATFFIGTFGVFIYILEALLSAIIGLSLIFKFKFLNMDKIYSMIDRNSLSYFGLKASGILLVLPGILSDIVAVFILMLVFIFNFKNIKAPKKYSDFAYNFADNFTYFRFNENNYSKNNKNNDDEIIDAEIIK